MKHALLTVLSFLVAVSCYAQRPFPDNGANHWAYRAIAVMESEGMVKPEAIEPILKSHPTTKLQMARAVFVCYQALKTELAGMQTELDVLKDTDPTDQARLKLEVAALQEKVAKMRNWGNDIAIMARAVRAFRHEYQTLHIDAASMKRDLDDLRERRTRLERVTL